jgi:putative inorganic carbon (HCO3(-)) transporter
MSFILTLLYIALAYIFPAEIFPELAPYRITLTVGLTGLGISLVRLIITGRYDVGRPQLYFLTGLTGIMMISLIWADRWVGGAMYVVEDFGVCIIMVLLVVWNIDSIRKLRTVLTLIIVLSVFLSAQGIAAFHYGYRADQLLMTDSGDDDDNTDGDPAAEVIRVRGFGVMHDPNDLALGLVCALPLLLVIGQKKRRISTLAFVLPPIVTLAYGIFLTHSRGAVLSIVALLLTGLMPRWGKVRTIVLTVVFAAAMVGLNVSGGRSVSSQDESATGRVESWSEGLQMLKEQPLLGVGYRNYTDHNPLTAHNSFVLCFAELGITGYFFWIGLLVTTFMQLSRISRMDGLREADTRRLANALRLSLVGFLFAAFFLSRAYIPLLYLLIGLSMAVASIATKQGGMVVLPPAGKLMRLISGWTLGSVVFMYAFVRINLALVK